MGKREIPRTANAGSVPAEAEQLLRPLMNAALAGSQREPGITLGELIAITDDGMTPLVTWPGQPGSAAHRAASLVDLHGAHINRRVALMFEAGNPTRPIVIGVLRESAGWPLSEKPGQVEVQADGERLVVSAREQLVLKCGKASLVLHRDGRIEVKGQTIVAEAAGAHRIRGGSVQLN